MDLRNLPAGDYAIRVFDPFEDPNSAVYRSLSAQALTEGDDKKVNELKSTYRRDVPLKYAIEIEAPKVGDSHAVLDRDEIIGGFGNDAIQGNGSVDRIYAGGGLDTVVAERLEYRDLGRVFGEPFDINFGIGAVEANTTFFLPSAVADFERSNIAPRPIDFAVNFDSDDANRTLERLIAAKLGLATYVTDDQSREFVETRTLFASDLTRLIELDASDLWRPLRGANGSVISPVFDSGDIFYSTGNMRDSIYLVGDMRDSFQYGDYLRLTTSGSDLVYGRVRAIIFNPTLGAHLSWIERDLWNDEQFHQRIAGYGLNGSACTLGCRPFRLYAGGYGQ